MQVAAELVRPSTEFHFNDAFRLQISSAMNMPINGQSAISNDRCVT